MLVLDGTVVYSASDLAAAAGCEYSLLRAFDAYLGWGPKAAMDDPLLARTARLGDEHEQRHLDELRAELGENATIIGRPPYTSAALTAAAQATQAAVRRRAPVIAQAAMFGYFLMSVFMIITGFALYSEHSQYAIFAPFRYVVEFFYWTGGNSMDIHSWHRLGMWLIGAFVIGHVYMALREDIMSDDTVISTMVNGYRSHKFGKISNKERS